MALRLADVRDGGRKPLPRLKLIIGRRSDGFSCLLVAIVALAAAGSRTGPAACKLNRAQRHGVARALADIRRLRRIEAPVQTFSDRGAPNENVVTGKLLLDLGSAHLPLSVYARLLHEAKAAVRLCGDCSTGLEGAEPVLGTRAHRRCG